MNKIFHCCLPKFLNSPNLCWENEPFLPHFLGPQMQIFASSLPSEGGDLTFPKPLSVVPPQNLIWWLYSSLEHHYIVFISGFPTKSLSLRVSKMGHLYLVLNAMVYPQTPHLQMCVK